MLLMIMLVLWYQTRTVIDSQAIELTKIHKQVDSLHTELHISQTNQGRYEIFYDVMKERHPKEAQDIMDSIE